MSHGAWSMSIRGNDCKACDRVSVVLMTHGAPHE